MKLHPIHTMLVHFPAALLPVDLVFGVVAQYAHTEALAWTGYYCLVGGVIGGWVAILSGLADLFIYVIRHGGLAVRSAFVHGAIQTVMVIGVTLVLAWEYKEPFVVTHPPLGLWLAKASLVLTMLAGNYLGGELLFRYVAPDFKKDS